MLSGTAMDPRVYLPLSYLNSVSRRWTSSLFSITKSFFHFVIHLRMLSPRNWRSATSSRQQTNALLKSLLDTFIDGDSFSMRLDQCVAAWPVTQRLKYLNFCPVLRLKRSINSSLNNGMVFTMAHSVPCVPSSKMTLPCY